MTTYCQFILMDTSEIGQLKSEIQRDVIPNFLSQLSASETPKEAKLLV